MKFFVLTSILISALLFNGVAAKRNDQDPQDQFDFIVIGSGSAGSTIAGKLSQNPKYRVLLLERGGDIDSSQEAQAQAFPNRQFARLQNPYLDHMFSNESITDIPAGSSNAFYYYGANALGGATTLHTLAYTLPVREDVEKWNLPEWNYERVQSYIARFENYRNLNDSSQQSHVVENGWRGGNGNFITQQYPGGLVTDAMYASAMDEWVLPFNPDINFESSYGVGQLQRSASGPVTDAKRSTSYDAWVKPHLKTRPNLVVRSHSKVTRIVFQKSDDEGIVRATGVEYVQFGKSKTATVSKEVILSASILRSPQLLLLSGIGDAQYLNQLNIPVQVDLPQVGKNLKDKMAASLAFVLPNTTIKTDGVTMRAGYNSGVDLNDDSQSNMATYVFSLELTQGGAGGVKFLVLNQVTYTSCDGSTELLDTDPLSDPKFRMNCWNNRDSNGLSIDVKHLNYAFKKTRSMMSRLSTKLGTRIIEASPGYAIVPLDASDSVINNWILGVGAAGFHPAGTCRMGTSPENSVVDQELKVWGTENLRVADISVLPSAQQGPPTGSAMVFAEAVVELLRQKWNP